MDLIPQFMQNGVYAVLCVVITGLASIVIAFIKHFYSESKGKVSDVDNKVDSVEDSLVKRMDALEEKINFRVDGLDKRVGDIVTEDISKLYREIATLQGDIKVLATELKNLNTNISTLFSSMSADITRTITQALAKRN